ncbi:hypothetical protein TRIUR3_33903 [Triticum urartu]|uniref:Uncharacterized protein n=1 Tax=Triticum urartu TaxID=4572 RepID=M8A6G6_TRIUA|nr:hypothetical protein TRIUR3_33903 [Triticum urartu]
MATTGSAHLSPAPHPPASPPPPPCRAPWWWTVTSHLDWIGELHPIRPPSSPLSASDSEHRVVHGNFQFSDTSHLCER